MHVLVVERDGPLADSLARELRRDGYAVDVANDIEDAHWFMAELSLDAVVLDLEFPDGDGLDLCEHVRAEGCWVPLLALTRSTGVAERVRALDAGADDVITVPIAPAELAARVRALLRRAWHERPAVLRVGTLSLDPASRMVWVGSERVAISGRALSLLEILMRESGRVVSRSELRDHAWDWAWDGDSNVIDVHVAALRAAIGRGEGVPVIRTVRSVGYRLEPPPEGEADAIKGPRGARPRRAGRAGHRPARTDLLAVAEGPSAGRA